MDEKDEDAYNKGMQLLHRDRSELGEDIVKLLNSKKYAHLAMADKWMLLRAVCFKMEFESSLGDMLDIAKKAEDMKLRKDGGYR